MQKTVFGRFLRYFSAGEWLLWGGSTAIIAAAFFVFDRENYLAFAASLLGAASLIFNAKGNPAGQALMIVFSVLYGIISYTFAYYGEMITYLGMTLPMAVFALAAWLKHPYKGRAQVLVNKLSRRELLLLLLPAAAVTAAFYFILRAFHTANLLPSTLSVATSFLAAYLTFRRSALFPLAYAANDAVLILLWSLAVAEDPAYVSVLVCFAMFFVNDIYGFFGWRRMQRQQSACPAAETPAASADGSSNENAPGPLH